MIDKIKKMIREVCMSDLNKFGMTAYKHISIVVDYSNQLANRLNANKRVVETAAWLHDWGSINGDYNNHHIIGAEFAESYLKFWLSKGEIDEIKHCIIAHRGSKDIPRDTIEAKIVASADAMSHFADIPDLFYLAYEIHKFSYEEGKKFVKEKLERSWKKIELEEGRFMIQDLYGASKIILEDENKEIKT